MIHTTAILLQLAVYHNLYAIFMQSSCNLHAIFMQ